jgi:hypothetical protein
MTAGAANAPCLGLLFADHLGDRMVRYVSLLAILVVGGASIAAEPKDDKITITYDVSELLHMNSKTSAYDSIDAIVFEIIRTVNPESWLAAPDSGNRIFEVNGTKLEIRATKAEHTDIKELLEAVRRLNDLAIDVKATFMSVDVKWFNAEVRQALGEDMPAKIGIELEKKLRGKSEIVQSAAKRLGNGREEPLASIRQAFTVAKPPADGGGKPEWGVEFTGVSLRARAAVSADRRSMKLCLDETVREPAATKKNDSKLKMIDKKRMGAVTIDDGAVCVWIVGYSPPTITDRGRVMVLLIEPVLFIEAEEKERRGKKDDG